MTKTSSLNCRLAKWDILLSQYEIQFMLHKAIKGQAVADFLADHPAPGSSKFYYDLPDEIAEVNTIYVSSEEQVWELFFNEEQVLRKISLQV